MQYLHTPDGRGGAKPEDVGIVSLATVLRRNAMRLLLAAAFVGIATAVGLSFLTPRYTSEAQLLIGGQGLNDRLRDPQVGVATPESVSVKVDKEAVASQVIALRSRDLADRLVLDLDLASKSEFSVSPGSGKGTVERLVDLAMGLLPGARQAAADRVLATYYRGLSVYQGKESRVITIQYSSTDSVLAARVANRLAELYQEWLRAQGVSQTADASEWLKPQIEKLSREVSDAEAEVERFRSEANLFRAGTQNSGLNEQQLADLGSEVTRARAARGDIEARAGKARELLQLGQFDVIPDVQRAPVIQALLAERARAEREKAEGDATLLARHPRMKQLDATLADLRRQIAREASIIAEGLEKEASAARLREELASSTLAEMKARVGDKAADMARLTALEGVAKAKRREIDTLQASFEAARSRGDAKAIPLEAQVISRAQPESVPSYPKRLQLSALAAAATFILGIVAAVTRELVAGMRQPNMPAPADRAARNAFTLAMPGGEDTRAYPVMVMSLGVAARHLRSHVCRDRGYRTLVTGLTVKIDARQHGAALVRLLPGPGVRAVLVDWNTDGRSIAEALGAASRPGMMELLEGAASLAQVIQPLPGAEAHIIASGGPSAKPAVLDADRVNLILDALDEAYDHIVFSGEYDALRHLFTIVEGRFDTVLEIEAQDHQDRSGWATPGMLFGCQVAGIEILRLSLAAAGPRRPGSLVRHSVEALA